jgi:hypothetical protein
MIRDESELYSFPCQNGVKATMINQFVDSVSGYAA